MTHAQYAQQRNRTLVTIQSKWELWETPSGPNHEKWLYDRERKQWSRAVIVPV